MRTLFALLFVIFAVSLGFIGNHYVMAEATEAAGETEVKEAVDADADIDVEALIDEAPMTAEEAAAAAEAMQKQATQSQDIEDKDTPPVQGGLEPQAAQDEDVETSVPSVSDNEAAEDVVEDEATYLPGIVMGDPDAPVTLHEFTSLTCPHCATYHKEILPVIRKEYVDRGDVKIVFHDMPLDQTAFMASRLLRCLPDDGAYMAMLNTLYQNQESWAHNGASVADKELRSYFSLAGMDDETYSKCLNNQDLAQKMARTIKYHAAKYGIESTPTIVVGDGERVIRGAGTIEGMRYMLDSRLRRAGITPPSERGVQKIPNAATDN